MSDVSKGDQIRATGPHGTLLEGRAFGDSFEENTLRVELFWSSPTLRHLESNGYTIEKIEVPA